jgi:hypothetical protein
LELRTSSPWRSMALWRASAAVARLWRSERTWTLFQSRLGFVPRSTVLFDDDDEEEEFSALDSCRLAMS